MLPLQMLKDLDSRDTYCAIWKFIFSAKKSILRSYRIGFYYLLEYKWFICYSLFLLSNFMYNLDVFFLPGTWAADKLVFFLMKHVQISLAIVLQELETKPCI